MALTDYTTFDDVRAALGVSSEELEDATLSLDVYGFSLLAELEEMTPSPLDAYLAIKDSDLETLGTNESRFFRATRLFATYSIARQLLPSLPMLAPKELSDGKATMVRFPSDPYKETGKRVESQYETAKNRLRDAFSALSATTSASQYRTYFTTVASSSDPVTGT